MRFSLNVSLLFSLLLFLGLFSSHTLEAQKKSRSLQRGSSSSSSSSSDSSSNPFDDDDPKIKASLNTVPSSGHDWELFVIKVLSADISPKPRYLKSEWAAPTMQTRQLNQGSMSKGGSVTPYSARKMPATSMMKKESPTVLKRLKLTDIQPMSKNISLSVRQPVVQGQASLRLKSPHEVNFIGNEVIMYKSTATASFKVQKGKSYIVKVFTRMAPNRRSKQVSLNMNYAMGDNSSSIALTQAAKSQKLETYEFHIVLLADGDGYINLDINQEEISGRWGFSKVEIQQVGY